MELMAGYKLQKKKMNELETIMETIQNEIEGKETGKEKRKDRISELWDNFRSQLYMHLVQCKKNMNTKSMHVIIKLLTTYSKEKTN